MTDDVLSAEQVTDLERRQVPGSPVSALCHSHEALRERLENAEHAVAVMTPEGFSEAMQTAIEDREQAEKRAQETSDQFGAFIHETNQRAIERRDEREWLLLHVKDAGEREARAEAALGRAVAFLYDLQGFGHDPTCLICGAEVLTKSEPHEDWCYLAKLLSDPTGTAALAQLRRLENLERVVREVRPRLTWIDGLTTDLERIDEALAALDEGEAQP